jgi:hypothetical protein
VGFFHPQGSIVHLKFTNEVPAPGEFTGKFYQTLKVEFIPVFCYLFQNIKAEGILPNSFYEARSTLIFKTDTTTKL